MHSNIPLNRAFGKDTFTLPLQIRISEAIS
jgi:hypothetical protein